MRLLRWLLEQMFKPPTIPPQLEEDPPVLEWRFP